MAEHLRVQGKHFGQLFLRFARQSTVGADLLTEAFCKHLHALLL